jgi:hypothetical protein
VGIFWSSLCSIAACSSYSILLGYELNKYTLIFAVIAGVFIGIDFKLSVIKNEIKNIQSKRLS